MTDQNLQPFGILVVDDEEIVQSLVKDALEDEGHRVALASNGEDALEIIKSGSVELLVTDIRMPGMDGIKLVKHARQVNPNLGIIYMTGYATLNSAKDAIKQGALDYVMKPFELNEIRTAIKNGIEKLRKQRSGSEDQLNSLTDLSNALFAAGDRKSLVGSSLKFAMMSQHTEAGAIVYFSDDRDEFVMHSVENDQSEEILLGKEPLYSLANNGSLQPIREPSLIDLPDSHPILQEYPDDELKKFLFPPWMKSDTKMIAVPVARSADFYGILMLQTDEETIRVKQSDLKYLYIAASQLAISLENESLLKETQQAYARLKALQDETIQLERMAARGEVSAELGHELNNFMGVIAGNIGLMDVNLAKGNLDDLARHLKAVNETLSKVKIFTNNLMDLGTISSTMDTIYFDRLITEVVEYLRPQRRFRDVSIELIECGAQLPMVGDVTQIQQVLYNLFNNAADATEGCPERRITATTEMDPDRNQFQVTIQDTGSGFDSDHLSQAFHEKFTTKPTGHGFGLVVCKRIVDKHKAQLEVESAPGEGARISIRFPLQQVEPALVS